MTEKSKIILSISFFIGLISLIIYSYSRFEDKMDRIDDNGAEAIGVIIKKAKPYKGASVLIYDFFVEEKNIVVQERRMHIILSKLVINLLLNMKREIRLIID